MISGQKHPQVHIRPVLPSEGAEQFGDAFFETFSAGIGAQHMQEYLRRAFSEEA
jgi:hypothetical protein